MPLVDARRRQQKLAGNGHGDHGQGGQPGAPARADLAVEDHHRQDQQQPIAGEIVNRQGNDRDRRRECSQL
jgi:hypothetical protein